MWAKKVYKMLVKGLDEKEYKLKLKSKPRPKASKLHIKARKILAEIFLYDIVYEEIKLAGTKRFNQRDLYADFFIPSQMLLVEVHGRQHYEKTFFHNSNLEFIQARARDKRKRDWCLINDILYIELPEGEKEDEWRERIINRESD